MTDVDVGEKRSCCRTKGARSYWKLGMHERGTVLNIGERKFTFFYFTFFTVKDKIKIKSTFKGTEEIIWDAPKSPVNL